jgi:hypothetical protein
MRQVTLTVSESRFKFFMELVRSFDFVKVEETTGDSREAILANVRQGLEEVSQIEQGKLKGRPAQQLLDEL